MTLSQKALENGEEFFILITIVGAYFFSSLLSSLTFSLLVLSSLSSTLPKKSFSILLTIASIGSFLSRYFFTRFSIFASYFISTFMVAALSTILALGSVASSLPLGGEAT